MLSITTALFDAGDKFPAGKLGIGLFDPETTAERFIRFRLMTEDERVRTELLKDALMQSSGFSLPLDFIAMEDAAARKRHPEIQFVVADSDVKWIEAHGLNLIRKKAEDGTLLQEDGSGFALGRWENWGPEGEAKAWVSKFATTPRNALVLLKRLAGRTTRGDEEAQPFLSAEYIERYIALDDMLALINQISENELSEEDKKHKVLLSTAVNLKKAGRPYAEVHLPGY
jgi:hypothetical protein